MSPLPSSLLILGFAFLFLLISPSHSLNCTSQNFTNNIVYANCTDLPYLSSYLHWTYNSSKSSLSIAFVAPPAKSTGWIAWAINPTGTGMIGAQALVALKESNGSMVVKTYNISSYQPIVESNISFHVANKTAEYSGGLMKIFAVLTVANNATVNQVWQVGSSVTGGIPDKHAFTPANLMAKGTLVLMAAQTNSTTNSTTPTPAPPSGSPAAPSENVSARIRYSNVAFYIFLLFVGVFCF
ncbi:auxin-induced in root cultures protein 12 [Cornus florida]|uniref:auxin-induced in root cultures protein 12 n=1 Tax=Cornus florida TaxID=4283 RepID=UPI00289F7B41|nr:auxin-induced in root cultures protein 12 [Cornus florida]